jgi:hypothetical protein
MQPQYLPAITRLHFAKNNVECIFHPLSFERPISFYLLALEILDLYATDPYD